MLGIWKKKKSAISLFWSHESTLCSQPEAQAAAQPHPQAHPPRIRPSRTFTSPLHLLSHTHPGTLCLRFTEKQLQLITSGTGDSKDKLWRWCTFCFPDKPASAVAIEMRREPCLEMRHLVTMAASALLSALSHQTPSWIKSLAGTKRRSQCTAPRLHMVGFSLLWWLKMWGGKWRGTEFNLICCIQALH